MLSWAVLLACGDDGRFVGVGDGRDAAVADGSTGDAAGDGSASGDGDGDGDRDGGGDGDGDGDGGDGGLGDGDGDGDGDGSDGGGIDDVPPQCEITDDDAREISVAIVESGFSIAPGATGFGLSYAREACQQALDVVRIESNGPFTDGTTLVDDCRTVLDVGIARSGSGYQLAYTDNSTDSVELHAIELDAELVPVGETAHRRLTDNGLIERRPAIADIAGTPLVAYITEHSYERAITTLLVRDGAEPTDLFERSDGRLPIELDISPIGAGAGIAWVEEAGQQGIWYQGLSDTGAAAGTPQQLSSFAAPNSTLDITRRTNDGGAIVFAVGIDAASQELRFQRLAEDGALRGDVIKLVSQPLQAKDAGIASVAGGYAIAYRALPDGETITEPQIRIAFITKYGRAVRDRAGRIVSHLIAPAQQDGSRVHLEVSVDGQLLLAFVDGNASGTSTLRLIRRTLGC